MAAAASSGARYLRAAGERGIELDIVASFLGGACTTETPAGTAVFQLRPALIARRAAGPDATV